MMEAVVYIHFVTLAGVTLAAGAAGAPPLRLCERIDGWAPSSSFLAAIL